MRWGWLACVMVGCVTQPDDLLPTEPAPPEGSATLRIEPASPAISVELDIPKTIDFRAIHVESDGSEVDVTADATWAVADAPLGTLEHGRFTSDGRTGGAATIVATSDGLGATTPLVVRIHSVRIIHDTPVDAPRWFAAATDTPYDAAIEPGDGAVLPSNLRLDVDFGAPDTDDLHEVALTGQHLDIRIHASGVAGPRHVELTSAESDAVGRTSRGEAVELSVRSLQSSAPDTARAAAVRLAIADRELSGTLLYAAGEPGDATLWTYEARSGAARWYALNDQCIGCHVAVSPDGTRIAATTAGTGTPPFGGLVLDTVTETAVSTLDTWTGAAFDPGGRLLTALQGILTLRDGTSAAPITTLTLDALAFHPTISPDGSSLAYAVSDVVPGTQPTGVELRVHDWNAADASVGPPRVIVANDGNRVKAPAFSPDGDWLVYSRFLVSGENAGVSVIAADGSAGPFEISADPRDRVGRWASSIEATRAGGADTEPMAWISMKSSRAVGVRNQDTTPHLWLIPFYPARGASGRPFHLPGQPADLAANHGAELLPAGPPGP